MSAPALEMQPTPLGRRLACLVYEGFLAFGVIFVAGLAFGVATQTHHALENRLGLQLFLFSTLGLYFSWFWSRGQTLAMKTWHLHLQTSDGASVSMARTFARYLICWLEFLPPVVITYSLGWNGTIFTVVAIAWVLLWNSLGTLRSDGQLPQDTWTRTRIVYIPPAKRPSKP